MKPPRPWQLRQTFGFEYRDLVCRAPDYITYARDRHAIRRILERMLELVDEEAIAERASKQRRNDDKKGNH